jgi:hypothetical protein
VTEIFDAEVVEERDHSDYLTGSGSDGDIHPQIESPSGASVRSPYPQATLGLERSESPDLSKSKNRSGLNPSCLSVDKSVTEQSRVTTSNIDCSTDQAQTTYYLTGADGSVEPVQVVLSIPEQAVTSVSGIRADSEMISTTQSNVTQPEKSTIPQFSATTVTTSTDMVPVPPSNEGSIGRY